MQFFLIRDKRLFFLFVFVVISILLLIKPTRQLLNPRYKRPFSKSYFDSPNLEQVKFKTIIPPEKKSCIYFEKPNDGSSLIARKTHYMQKPTGVFIIKDGIASSHYGLTMLNSKVLLRESCDVLIKNCNLRDKIWYRANGPHKKISGTAALIAGPYSNCYYHWLLDILPRFLLLEKIKEKIDYYLLPAGLRQYQIDSLKFFLDPDIPILQLGKTNLKFDQLILPYIPHCSQLDVGGLFYQSFKWCIDYVTQKITCDRAFSSDSLVYISRAKAGRRKITNEREVQDLLKRYGFKTFIFEGLSLKDQINVIRNAKVVVSTHGAGLTNLIFCDGKCKVLELFPNQSFTLQFPLNDDFSLYPRICYFKKLIHYFMIGKNSVHQKTPWKINSSNFSVDLLDLENRIKCLLNEKTLS